MTSDDAKEPKIVQRPRNMAASVNRRLLNRAHEQREDFSILLTRYALERLLYRLTQSEHASSFVLKGALLFSLWSGHPHRATRDLDLLGYGEPNASRLEGIFRNLCLTPVDDDGLTFLADSVQATLVREDQEYNGLRINLRAMLDKARIPLQVDIGFGDAVTPAPVDMQFPTMLDFPSANVRAYTRETVIAEKFQAMVKLGIANSRMKDFYDIHVLARLFPFDGPLLRRAIQTTFDRRRTAVPEDTPLALTDEFANDTAKQAQWTAFMRKGKLEPMGLTLAEVIVFLQGFIMPPTLALARGKAFDETWLPGGPWQSTTA